MRRACRGTAPRTSGQHPEPDPDLSSLRLTTSRGPTADRPALQPRALRPWALECKGRVSARRNSWAGEGGWVGLAFTLPLGAWEQEGMTLRTGHFVGRADELRSVEQILEELDRGSTG